MNARLLLLCLPLLVACSGGVDPSTSAARPHAVGPGGDAGVDSGASTTTPVNDPRCPASWYPLSGTACTPIGLNCTYPGPAGGDALFCLAPGSVNLVDASALPAGYGVWVSGV